MIVATNLPIGATRKRSSLRASGVYLLEANVQVYSEIIIGIDNIQLVLVWIQNGQTAPHIDNTNARVTVF